LWDKRKKKPGKGGVGSSLEGRKKGEEQTN